MEETRAITLKKYSLGVKMTDFIMSINMDKIAQLSREFYKDRPIKMPELDNMDNIKNSKPSPTSNVKEKSRAKADKERLVKLINEPTAIRKIVLKRYEEISSQMLSSNEKAVLEAFKSKIVNRIVFCENGTRDKCMAYRSKHGLVETCTKVHFKKIIMPHTDENLGNCSYLDTCRHMEYCKFVHYEIDEIDQIGNQNILVAKNQIENSIIK